MKHIMPCLTPPPHLQANAFLCPMSHTLCVTYALCVSLLRSACNMIPMGNSTYCANPLPKRSIICVKSPVHTVITNEERLVLLD